jgi:pyrimidine operon attenuation protein/uracil phosphoribosyltransferase
LADRVFILTYVRGYRPGPIHQSAYTVRFYKTVPPVPRCAADMALMVRAAGMIHSDCVEKAAGAPWSAVTFVSSASRPGAVHPVAELARQIKRNNAAENRLLLEPGTGFSAEPDRSVRPDRFMVPAAYVDRIRNRHVLLVDDTWTTGSKLQSAAVALHDAGARNVTALCVARWCRDDWPEHRTFLDRLATPYDAMICPTTGGACP